jgi:hypothetical protein
LQCDVDELFRLPVIGERINALFFQALGIKTSVLRNPNSLVVRRKVLRQRRCACRLGADDTDTNWSGVGQCWNILPCIFSFVY